MAKKKVTTKEAKVKEPVVEVKEPVVEVKEPVVEVKEPVVEVKEPVVEVKETPVEPVVKAPIKEAVKPVLSGNTRSKIFALIDLDFVNKNRVEGKTVVETSYLVSAAAGKELGFSDASNLKIARKIALQVLRK